MSHYNLYNVQSPSRIKNTRPQRIKDSIPKFSVFFFILFLLNTIIPLFDLPVIGLSLTAPLMLIVSVQTLLKPSKPWFRSYSLWWFLAGTIWIGWFLSAIINSFIGNLEPFSSSQVLYFLRTAYWCLVMVITTYIVSQKVNGVNLLRVLSIGVLILGLIRISEAIFFNRIGPGTSRVLSQNANGLLFSSFAIYPIILLIEAKGRNKIIHLLSLLIVYSAIIINSSRTNWVALTIGIMILVFVLLRVGRIKWTGIIVGVSILLFLLAFRQFFTTNFSSLVNTSSPIVQRLQTFQNLDDDLSLATRQYLVNKGIAQFKSSPIFGIGIEQGRFVFLDVKIPDVLSGNNRIASKPLNEHNSYIPILAETGLMGSIPFASLLIILIIKGFKSALYLSKQKNIWAAGIFASYISMSIHLWTITGIRNTGAWVVYGLVGGMIMVAQQQSRISKVNRE